MLRKAKETKLKLIQESNKRLLKEYNKETVKSIIDYVIKKWPKSKIIKQTPITVIELPNEDKLNFDVGKKKIEWWTDGGEYIDSTTGIDISLKDFERWFDYGYTDELNESLINEYSWKEESPLESEIRRKVGLVFATWMSPDNPPFAQEYLYDPKYFDGLISNIMDAVNDKTNTQTRY